MKNMHITTRDEAVLRLAAKAVVYQLLGEQIESGRLSGIIVDDKIPTSYGESVNLTGKLKFRVEKTVIVITAAIWAKEILGSKSERLKSSELEEIIFDLIGGFKGFRSFQWLPQDSALCAAALSIREMPFAKPTNRYCQELAENHIRFLINQTLVLMGQPPISAAIKAVVTAMTDKYSLSGDEIRKVCSETEYFDEMAKYGLIYAGPEFRKTALK